MDTEFSCAFCFQTNSIFVDPSGGTSQTYVEDCQVCCQPNMLSIYWDDLNETYTVDALPE